MSPLDWVSSAATMSDKLPYVERSLAAGMRKEDLVAGDHVYTWKMGWTYNHHGIVVATKQCPPGCPHDSLLCCSIVHFRPPCKTAMGRIEICSLSSFAEGREIYRCSYGVPNAEFYVKRSGCCSANVADARSLTVLRALSLPDVSSEPETSADAQVEYDFLVKNSELLSCWCKIGKASGVQRFCSSEKAFSAQTSPGRFARLGLAAVAVVGAATATVALTGAASASSTVAAASGAAATTTSEVAVSTGGTAAVVTALRVSELAAAGSAITKQVVAAGNLAASEAARHLLLDMVRRPHRVQDMLTQVSEAVRGGSKASDGALEQFAVSAGLRACLADLGVAVPAALQSLLDSPQGCSRLCEMLSDVLEAADSQNPAECAAFVDSFLCELSR